MRVLKQLWSDERAFVVSTELVVVATILVLSMVVGMKKISSQVLLEMSDVGNAVGSLNQGYSFAGAQFVTRNGLILASWSGTGPFIDRVDVGAGDYVPIGTAVIPASEFGAPLYVRPVP